MSELFISAELAKVLGFETCRRCDRLFSPDSSPVAELCLGCHQTEDGE